MNQVNAQGRSILSEYSHALTGLVAAAAPSVVAVEGGGRVAASGFVWRPGLVIAAEESLERDEGLFVRFADGARLPATLLGRDPSTDVALLRVDGATAPALTLSSPDLAAGALVVAVGRAAEGDVARHGAIALAGPAWRSMRGGHIDRLIRLDVVASPAIQGGALLDADGAVFGMLVLGPRRRALAIPAATIERVAQTLLDKGRVGRGYLGLGLRPIRLDPATADAAKADAGRALIIVNVDPKGPAAAAGLHVGDVLVSVDGVAVGGMRTLAGQLGPESVGRVVTLALVRAGASVSASLTIGERPEA